MSWISMGALIAAGGSFALVAYLWRHREAPGAVWFVWSLTAQGGFCLLAGVSPFVPAGPQPVLDALALAALCCTGPLFLAFALEYTGRRGLVDGRAVVPVGLAAAALVATDPVHGAVFETARSVPATGSPPLAPTGLAVVALGMAMAGVGVALLIEAMLSYGPLYRREAAAAATSTLPPTVGLVAWLEGVAPAPALAFVGVTFLPHVLLDAYAFVESGMFETNPTTRRAADRTAIDDIGTPVLVLDPDGRVVDYNTAADPLLEDPSTDCDRTTLLGEPVSSLVDLDADAIADGGSAAADLGGSDASTAAAVSETADDIVTVRSGGRRREFLVSQSTLTDPRGEAVGTTLVFQDVTRERRREQRLDVLNRVLRHNLRNKMTAVAGNATLIESRVDDERLTDVAAIIDSSARELLDIGEKARRFERCRRGGPRYRAVDLTDLVDDAVGDSRSEVDRLDVEADDETVVTDPELLTIALTNLVENAVRHVDDPTVSVTATVGGGDVRISVADDGPGIPAEELEPLDAGGETPLVHATGIGLWVVQWSVDALGGGLSFDTDHGTTATLRVPHGPDHGRDSERPESI
ncbi:MAG: histidine kinase N-terminal 7TM domain-containing protein [Halosimplex sp.]